MHFSSDSQNGKIERALVDASGEWVSLPALMEAADSANVHSRVNDLRQFYAVENRIVPDKARRHRRLSYYRIPTLAEPTKEGA